MSRECFDVDNVFLFNFDYYIVVRDMVFIISFINRMWVIYCIWVY